MNGLWERKWLVPLAAVVVFLAVGAGAWAATSESVSPDSTAVTDEEGQHLGATLAPVARDRIARPGAEIRGDLQEKRAEWRERHIKLMEALRDDMSPEDQARYDQLVEEAKQQREVLQNARDDLLETMKQLHELTDTYLDGSRS